MVTKKTTKPKATRTKKTTRVHKAEVETPAPVAATAEHPREKTPVHKGKYVFGVGRRKTSVAKVRLYNGNGSVMINTRPLADYFAWLPWQREALAPLSAVGVEKNYDVVAQVYGGGLHSQAGAVSHGLARALLKADEARRKVLKVQGLLTRDARVKERKKPGLKRARRAPQWSKR